MKRQLTMGSLFDGIGGFMLAAVQCGIKPVWAAEIEPNCISITRRHFPDVMHVGSVTELKGDEIPPVDIITFGSPCQNLSVAGNRKGLDGEESGLFKEAIRIIEEMRIATNGEYPTFVIWENVPGAFSSNDRQDFRTVLEKITKAYIPMPKFAWTNAGMVRGGTVDTAWRTFNAEHWGVPRRRRRIYLVGDFGGQRAGEVLFKPESVLGYSTQSGKEKTEVAGTSGICANAENKGRGTAGFTYKASATAGGIGYKEEIAPTLKTDSSAAVIVPEHENGKYLDIVLNDQGGSSITVDEKGICPTLRAQTHGNLPCVVKEITGYDISHADVVIREFENVTPALLQRMGTGGNQVPIILKAEEKKFYEAYQHHGYRESEISGTLTMGQNEGVRGDTPIVIENVIPIRSETTRLKESNGLGVGEVGGPAPTLTVNDIHNVFYEERENDKIFYEGVWSGGYKKKEISCTIMAQQEKQNSSQPLVMEIIRKALKKVKYIIRRLTPCECERLQGYPDNWTRWGADGEEIADTARYRATGNSIAVPCAVRVFQGIVSVLGGADSELSVMREESN